MGFLVGQHFGFPPNQFLGEVKALSGAEPQKKSSAPPSPHASGGKARGNALRSLG